LLIVIVVAAARPQARDTLQTCTLRPTDFNGLPVKISLHGSILLQRRVLQPLFVEIVARRFLITRAAGKRWSFRLVRLMFNRCSCLKLVSFGIRVHHGHVHPTTYPDSLSIQNGGDKVPPFDLQSAQIAVAVIVGLLTILGTIFGWFGRAWHWIVRLRKPKAAAGTIEVPSKTMILIPMPRANALWWHMGAMGNEPAMQIVGDLNVTNISKYGVIVMGAKLRKPEAVGHAIVRAQDQNLYSSKHMISSGGVSDLRFDFFVQPPVRKPGEPFRADVAIIDQFGNEHWIKKIQFSYA
jgi:hypothetical protein